MNTKNTSTLGPIKKISLIIIIAFFSILISFAYFNYHSSIKENQDKLIINVFGKQRLYTQIISKDANRLHALMRSLESNKKYQSEYDINRKIKDAKDNLQEARQDFAATLTAMHNESIYINSHSINIKGPIEKVSELLKKIDPIWSEFDKAIEVLVQSTEINRETTNAVIYINDNNMELLTLCDNVLQVVLEDSIKSAKNMEYLFYGLIGLLSAVTFVALFHLINFIILPYNRLYQGISDIGLDKDISKLAFPTKNKVAPIVAEINDMFKKINVLISLIENINNNASFTETLNFINRTFTPFIPYNYIGIALIDKDRNMRASYGVSDGSIIGLPEKVLGITWPISNTSLESLFQSGKVRIINDLEEYTANKPLKPYNKIILEAGIKASITLPLEISGEPVGIIFFSSNKKNVYNEEHLKILRTLVNSIAISLNQTIFINDLIYSSILALAKLAESRDEDTGEHLNRMKFYSRTITELLYENNIDTDEITFDYIENIERFSPLHDIGKVGIRDGILLKPAKLTSEEFDEMKRHAAYGAEVLRVAEENIKKRGKSLFGMGIEIAEGHHEKWDGSGYPFGKKGKEIPLSARIVAVADVFDALTSRRPYKESFSFDDSMQIIEEGRGKHFDPDIVDVFIANREKIRDIYKGFQMK